MIEISLSITLILSLFTVIYQDIKMREIHVILPVLVFVIGFAINYFSPYLDLYDILRNVSFIAINVIGLIVYFSLKNKALVNPIDDAIGLGDVLFFIAMSPLFSLKSFIGFFVISLLVSMLIHGIVNLFKEVKTIPLAGYMALSLAVFISFRDVFNLIHLF